MSSWCPTVLLGEKGLITYIPSQVGVIPLHRPLRSSISGSTVSNQSGICVTIVSGCQSKRSSSNLAIGCMSQTATVCKCQNEEYIKSMLLDIPTRVQNTLHGEIYMLKNNLCEKFSWC